MQADAMIPKKEFRAYYIGAMGQGMVYSIMSSYISDFYINVLRVGPLFVLLLMLFARFWDAANDPVMGILMDRSQPKGGKMKPYIKYAAIPAAFLTLLLFYAPDILNGAKMVYAAVTYVLWATVYTVSDVPFWSLPNIMTASPSERGKLISVSRTANGVGGAVPMALFMLLGFVLPQITKQSGVALEQTKYLTIVVLVCAIGIPLFLRVPYRVTERIAIPPPKRREKGQPGVLALVFRCKPLLLVAAMGLLSAGRYMFQAGAVHVARYAFYIGKPLAGLSATEQEQALQSNISTVSLIFSLSTALGMFATMVLISKLIDRFQYKQLLLVSCTVGGLASLAMYFVGYAHFWLCLPFLLLSSIPLGAINVIAYAMIGDSLDYMEWKTGVRLTGLGNALQSFVLQLGNALATSGIVLMYLVVNLDIKTIGMQYTANPTLLAPAVRSGMFSLVSLVPAISLLLCMIPIFFYDLTGEKKDKITHELAEMRKQREAAAQL